MSLDKIEEAKSLIQKLLPPESHGECYDTERLFEIVCESGNLFKNKEDTITILTKEVATLLKMRPYDKLGQRATEDLSESMRRMAVRLVDLRDKIKKSKI